jgi:hypothetical protein
MGNGHGDFRFCMAPAYFTDEICFRRIGSTHTRPSLRTLFHISY